MSKQLLSFKADESVKQFYLNRLLAHEKADEIIQGVGWEDGKGCAVGCTLNNYDHAAYETELGLPEWLARLEDTLFENIPNADAKKFPRELLEAIPVGRNLDKVKWQFCSYLINENIERVLKLTFEEKLKQQVLDAQRQVLAVHTSAIKSGVWDESAAWSAESAAWSAESAAESAAWSVWSAESAAFIRYKDKLIELLKEA